MLARIGSWAAVLGSVVTGKDETYSEEETERRREAALKRLLSTPPKPQGKLADERKRTD